VAGWFDDTHEKLIKVIERYQELQVPPGFEKDADGNLFVAHDTSLKSSKLGINE
jgi:hypothetical protein